MAKGLKELRQRVASIKNTKKITRAMEMVAAAKLRRTQDVMESARPFTRRLEDLLARLAASPWARQNPLFEKRDREERPVLFVLFTSDRGLCGAYNQNLIKVAERALAREANAQLYCVGRKGRDYFRKRLDDEHYAGDMIDLDGSIDGTLTDKLGKMLVDKWHAGEVSEINLVAPEFVSTSTNRPRVGRFLPLDPQAFTGEEASSDAEIDYLLEPTPQRVFDVLLPRYLQSKIYLTLAESFTSENASRMLAMNNATKNCDELRDKLTLQMNKARQAAITTEIVEIVSGAEALEG